MTRYGPRALALAGVSGCAVALGCPSAFAQPADAAGAQLEEVVVTAQRRDERLQDVPISVTALNTAALERQQVTDVLTLAKVVPAMQTKQTFTPTEMTVAIRGVTMLIPSINVDPPIGIYMDGVYKAINAGSNTAMVDMERAEVLKGPQGTLFGRNTIGGAINMTTAKPTNDFGGYVEGKVGNYRAWTATGVLNLPLAEDKLAARLVYQHDQHDGYGTNVATGQDVFTADADYFRATVKANPNENWEFLLSGSYTNAEGASPGTRLGFIDTTSQLFPPPAPPLVLLYPALSGRPGDSLANYRNLPGFWDASQSLNSNYDLKQYGMTGTITGQLNDYVTVKSITGYSETEYNARTDIDGTPYVVLDLLEFPINFKQFSEEFQVYGDAMDGRFTWIAGAYYFVGKGDQVSRAAALPAVSAAFGLPATFNPQGPLPTENTSVSAFAQVTYEILPKLRLTGGVRRVRDERKITYRDHVALGTTPPGTYLSCNLANAPGDPNPANCVFSDSVVFKYTPWTVGIDYKPTGDSLVYAKISKGFRSGAFGLTGPVATLPSAAPPITPAQAATANAFALANFGPVAPEKLLSYEVGAKVELLDNRLRINGAAYWSEYDNLQITVNLPAACSTCTPAAVLQNSGKAEIWGGELEVNALLGPLQLDGGLGYVHPKYVEGPSVGQPVINVSKWNWSVSGSWPIEMDMGTLTLGATYSYRSKAFFYPISPGIPAAATAALSQKGYGLLDARASFAVANMPVILTVFGANLTKEKYITSATNFAPPLSFAVNWPGPPRTYGMSLRYSF